MNKNNVQCSSRMSRVTEFVTIFKMNKRKPLNLKQFVNNNKIQYCPKVKGILGCISNAPRRIESKKINLFIFGITKQDTLKHFTC